jgi:hypothetical protein
MLRWLRRLLAMSLCTLILFGAFEGAAGASGVARVSGVDIVGQKWCGASLKVRWHAVSGASYQVRWARSKSGLKAAQPKSVGRNRALVGPLSLTAKSYVQVRAVRAGRAGAWSKVRVGHFTSHPLAKPALSGSGVPGGVRFTWGCTNYATRYRVLWSAAPHGYWPSTTNYVSGWLSQGTRSSSFRVPAIAQPGDHMLGAAYANPVWGRLQAGNRSGGTRLSVGWIPVFPTPPNPGSGDGLRIGTYNVMLSPGPGARVNAIAANISQHGLAVVALQEATATTARAVVAALGSSWAYDASGTDSGQQILYRTDRYGVDRSGTFPVRNPKDPAHPILTPWAHLVPLASADPGHGQSFYVASVHFTINTNKSALDQKADNGLSAQDVVTAMATVDQSGEPIVVAGDLFNLREPFGDVAGHVEAQPTFVRRGYYDSMAALRKTGIQYTTYNGGTGTTSARQSPSPAGVASRTDYLMLKGFRGSNGYVNVVNWSSGGIDPSDHNLVYADLTVPFAP